MKSIIIVLIFSTLAIKDTVANCNFPDHVTGITWLLRRTNTVNVAFDGLMYRKSYAYTLETQNSGQEKKRYTCDAYKEDGAHFYYIRSHQEGNNNVKTCVKDHFVNNVILHQEDSSSSAVSSIDACVQAIKTSPVYSVYFQATIFRDYFDVSTNVSYPFENVPFQVSYTYNKTDMCVDDEGSTLAITGYIISLIACDYKNSKLPLTGTITCNSIFTGKDLGESDESGGGVMLLQWRTQTTKEAYVYCARYKVIGKNITLSIDVSSTSEVMCLRDSSYNWNDTHSGREYVKLNLNYRSNLVSKPISTTTRSTALSSSSTTTSAATTTSPMTDKTTNRSPVTLPPGQNSISHVQFLTNLSFSNAPKNREVFKRDIQKAIVAGLNNQIKNEQFLDGIVYNSSSDGKLVVTMNVKSLTSEQETKLRGLVEKDHFKVKTSNNNVVMLMKGKYYEWKDSDKCPAEQCANGGRCWSVQGTYSCQCPIPYSSPYCKVEASTGNRIGPQTLRIIIGVCCAVALLVILAVVIFVVIRRRKSKMVEEVKSPMNYPYSNGTIDERDREMYSTINKKPKAYHDKSFVDGADDDKEHGELTGIHM